MRDFIEQTLHVGIIAVAIAMGFFIYPLLKTTPGIENPVAYSLAASACAYVLGLAAVSLPLQALIDLGGKAKTTDTKIAPASLIVATIGAGAGVASVCLTIKG